MSAGADAQRPARVWLLLVAATLASWWLAEDLASGRIAATAAILIAAFKINLVVAHFMELRWRPRPWRMAIAGWIALVTAIILAGYWVA